MNIYGKKVLLRAIEEKDCEFITEMFNDPEIENLVVGWAFPVSIYSQKEWLKQHYNDANDKRFVIETMEGEAVGIAVLNKIDWKNRRANHGIKIANRDFRGKGIGTDTVMAVMRYAFEELNLVRLDSAWFPDHEASRALYSKCGWKEEGLRRKYVFKHGSYRDLYITGVLAEDYYELIRNNHYWDENVAGEEKT